MPTPEVVRFVVELEGEEVDLGTYDLALRELRTALWDVEEQLTRRPPQVAWIFDDEPVVRAVASPDGVNADTLLRIVREVRAGFKSVLDAEGHPVKWPATFGERAKRAVKKIIRQLERVNTITVAAHDAEPLTISRAVIRYEVGGRVPPLYAEVSSLDGVLDLISVRGRPHFGLEEHVTGRRVRCSFPEAMFEEVKKALGSRVVVEGLVKYRHDGTPVSIGEVRSLWVRPAVQPIAEIVGKFPDFTGGLPAGEYVRRMREDDDDARG